MVSRNEGGAVNAVTIELLRQAKQCCFSAHHLAVSTWWNSSVVVINRADGMRLARIERPSCVIALKYSHSLHRLILGERSGVLSVV
jgi:hypothetical protein